MSLLAFAQKLVPKPVDGAPAVEPVKQSSGLVGAKSVLALDDPEKEKARKEMAAARRSIHISIFCFM